jgi:hypothetical protein
LQHAASNEDQTLTRCTALHMTDLSNSIRLICGLTTMEARCSFMMLRVYLEEILSAART